MIQKLRWWLVRKLIGRSSVLVNVFLESNGKDVEICLGSSCLFYGNHIVGDWPTIIDNGRVRMMTRSLALKQP